MNEELKEIEKMIEDGKLRTAFSMLDKKIKTNPQLSKDAFYLIDKGFDSSYLNPRSSINIYLVLSTITCECPELGEKVLERFKKGFSLIQDPEDINVYYDFVEPLVSNRPDLYEGLFELQHQVEAHYKKLGGDFCVGYNVYRMVERLTESLPNIGQIYLKDVDQKLSSQKVDAVDLKNVSTEMSQIIHADSKWVPFTLPLVEKALDKNENTPNSLVGFYCLLEDSYKKSPDSRDYILRLFPKALRHKKNDEDSLERGKEIYADIQEKKRMEAIQSTRERLAEMKSEKAVPAVQQSGHSSNLSKPNGRGGNGGFGDGR